MILYRIKVEYVLCIVDSLQTEWLQVDPYTSFQEMNFEIFILSDFNSEPVMGQLSHLEYKLEDTPLLHKSLTNILLDGRQHVKEILSLYSRIL